MTKNNLSLFNPDNPTLSDSRYSPLAERLRPQDWSTFELSSTNDVRLRDFLEKGIGTPPSMILWGPPGCGKTTWAKLVGKSFSLPFHSLSAVLSGVKDIREIVTRSKEGQAPTILFVDEIHRFNKGQQDAFLPHIEDGSIILIGATTENPSFYLTGALLSRCKLINLSGLSLASLNRILDRSLSLLNAKVDEDTRQKLVLLASGDARYLLNIVEGLVQFFGNQHSITSDELVEFVGENGKFNYDRNGEHHYDLASAFIKSLRGSNPDAALYWGFRMLAGGEEPRFLIRRMIIFASEDIGNADPRAIQIATATADAFERVGLPEGRISIAQCITFLATAPKSNRSYQALQKVEHLLKEFPNLEVPLHLRNAPTKLMQELGWGKGYAYPHDSQHGFVAQEYLPTEISKSTLYEPKNSGYEKQIRERMDFFKKISHE